MVLLERRSDIRGLTIRANSLVLAVLIILGVGLSLGAPVLLAEPAGQEEPALPDPTWQRLGLPESPTPESGRGVGIVLIDSGGLHPAMRHLGERLKHVTVADDMSVSLVEPLKAYHKDREDAGWESHGGLALLLMASAPFRFRDRIYGGLAPGATYFVVPCWRMRSGEDADRRYRYDPRLDRALDWIVENREQWNIRVIYFPHDFYLLPSLAFDDPRQGALIKNTADYPLVHALQAAVKAGILVVAATGNTSTENNLPPAEWLSVGGYVDAGHADPRFHRENPDEPYGRNSDGHERPDLLAPRYLVPNRLTPQGDIAYVAGASAGSAHVTALCAILFARFPHADAEAIKYALIRSGDPLPGSRRPGVCVNAARAIQMLKDGSVRPPWPRIPPPITVTDPNSSLGSKDAIERALALSALAWHPALFRPKDGEGLRQVFWRLLADDAPMVRKSAAGALARAESDDERRRLWGILHQEPDMGVRGWLAGILERGAKADPLDDWIPLATDPNFTARWYARKVLQDYYPDAPRLEYAELPEEIEKKAQPVLDWYRARKQSR